MERRVWGRRVLWSVVGVVCLTAAVSVGGCGQDQEESEGESGGALIDSAAVVSQESRADAEHSAEAWLADRYGPESGIIELELRSEGETTRQVRYFTDHGRREALYWYAFGDDVAPYRTVLRGDTVFARGPADSTVQQWPWDSSLPVALPNFRHLNDAMRERYQLEELGTKEFLGHEATGYELHSDPTTSRIWVWNGLMLYGEIDGIPERNIQPMKFVAVDLKLDVDIPEERFNLD